MLNYLTLIREKSIFWTFNELHIVKLGIVVGLTWLILSLNCILIIFIKDGSQFGLVLIRLLQLH